MESIKYNNKTYDVVMQGIDRANTITYQEVCIYPEREFSLQLVLVHGIHLFHWPFLIQVYLPQVSQNCFQELGVQNLF